MKYICKKDCYVKNPQGIFQLFKAGDVVDYSDKADVCEHFKRADGKRDEPDEKEKLKSQLKELGESVPANASVATLRKKIKEAQEK
ncbi:hypothetical protein [Maridesulfovibrio hydrothermalis]|uniref:Uncharacterized protein n=1 Tax=Maridesulfovibrio hydrothermalis AM13 = DSM 14728 TaxID=1121451 RepID=L0RE82_9BACT|nr:hypothetical protein [Maridesulfovibrio hydrothermalis]CCO25103.1 conserved protein of unknown function [Maridesulfovibrio hydrothermalis AM13 = DSM 14728]